MTQLNEFETVEEARAYSYTVQGDANSGAVLAKLVPHGINTQLKDIASTAEDPLRSLADAAVDTWKHKDVFAFSNPDVVAMLDAFVLGGIITVEQKTELLLLGQEIVQPYKDCTLVQFNNAKKIHTQIKVENYQQGKNLKVTLIDTLPETCAITTWEQDGDFGYDYFGKSVHVNPAKSTYKLKLDNKAVDGELFVRIPFENFNCTIELI